MADLLSGGSESETTTGTKEPLPRSPSQELIWDEFMTQVFGSEGVREIKQREIADLESQLGSQRGGDFGLRGLMFDYGIMGQIDDLQKEIDAIPESRGLLSRLEEDVSAQRTADETFGAATGGITDAFTKGITGDVDRYNIGNNQLVNAVAPVATSSPINLKFGDFQTPITTGSQRHAQGALQGLSSDRLAANLGLRGDVRDADIGQAGLVNQLERRNVPNLAYRDYLDFITGQANLGDRLRFSLPQTTGTKDTDTTLGPMDIVSGVSDIVNPFS